MDCGALSIYARGGRSIKMLDVKRKLMLLAIEEEIAHLELQMLHVDDHAYLGSLSAPAAASLGHFETKVLKPALALVAADKGGDCTPSAVTSSDILERFHQEVVKEEDTTTPQPKSAIQRMREAAVSVVNKLKTTGPGEPVTPDAPNKGWFFSYGDHTIYVMLRYFPTADPKNPKLMCCVRKVEDMEAHPYNSLAQTDWYLLWSAGSSAAQKAAFFNPHITQLARMIREAPSGIPNPKTVTTPTPQTNHPPSARGGKRP
jgi:hypothetical protein